MGDLGRDGEALNTNNNIVSVLKVFAKQYLRKLSHTKLTSTSLLLILPTRRVEF